MAKICPSCGESFVGFDRCCDVNNAPPVQASPNKPAPSPNNMANSQPDMANTPQPVANKTYRYRDAEKRRAYMRAYMKRRRP